MIASIREFWYMWLILAALIAVAVWAGIKASKAVKKRGAIMRSQREELERYQFLFEKYSCLTREKAEIADAKELAEGVTAVLQKELEKSPDPDGTFKNAEKWRREVYALYYFDEDCKESLSYFFKRNEKPLPDEAVNGLESIGEAKLRSLSAAMWSMYDEQNENVSLDSVRAGELDKKFKEIYDQTEFFEKIKNYIIEMVSLQ